MYYLATKSELTSIADGIREVTGKSGKISYPFIEAIDNIQTLSLDNYDTLIGFTYDSRYASETKPMEDLPESTYITFISDPYISSTVTPAIFNFKYISTYNKLKIKGFTFNKATSLKGSYVQGQYDSEEGVGWASRWYWFRDVEEVILPQLTEYSPDAFILTPYGIGSDAISHIKHAYVPKLEKLQSGFFSPDVEYISLSTVTEIGSYAFKGCAIEGVFLPECTKIAASAFLNCFHLKNITIPKCTTIEKNAFEMCPSLSTISLPKVTNIPQGAFKMCESLSVISLPEVTNISQNAFARCYGISEVYLKKCISIGESAFQSAGMYISYSITPTFYLSMSSVPQIEQNTFPSYVKFYVPESLYSAYLSDTNWLCFASQIISTKNF